MDQKRPIDASGAAALVGIALLLAFNQVVIKVTGSGLSPVFQAGLRSALACVFLLGWMKAFAKPLHMPRAALWGGVFTGVLFTVEFICIFTALDQTTVSRSSILFYSMPVWLTLAGHVLLPGERLSRGKVLGLVLAMGGIVVSFAHRDGGQASLVGDLLALTAAVCWAGIALVVRMTALSRTTPEMQLLSQLVVSAPLLLLVAPLFGDLIRAFQPIHLASLAFQAFGVACLGFLAWFRLLATYQASGVASFSFLTPVLAVVLGWLLLGEQIVLQTWIALALVAAGIYLINRS